MAAVKLGDKVKFGSNISLSFFVSYFSSTLLNLCSPVVLQAVSSQLCLPMHGQIRDSSSYFFYKLFLQDLLILEKCHVFTMDTLFSSDVIVIYFKLEHYFVVTELWILVLECPIFST
jgi:hypothetical protein